MSRLKETNEMHFRYQFQVADADSYYAADNKYSIWCKENVDSHLYSVQKWNHNTVTVSLMYEQDALMFQLSFGNIMT